MPEIGTSGLMSGVGKRGGARRQYPRPTSTLPANAGSSRRFCCYYILIPLHAATILVGQAVSRVPQVG